APDTPEPFSTLTRTVVGEMFGIELDPPWLRRRASIGAACSVSSSNTLCPSRSAPVAGNVYIGYAPLSLERNPRTSARRSDACNPLSRVNAATDVSATLLMLNGWRSIDRIAACASERMKYCCRCVRPMSEVGSYCQVPWVLYS